MRALAAAALGVTAVWARPALADDPRFDASLGVGYAGAAGSLERLSRVSDTTFGLLPLDLAFGYAPRPGLVLVLGGGMAAAIPRLCAGAGDCIGSLGRDFTVTASVRYRWPRLAIGMPQARLGMGYEVYVAELTDQGAHASRAYDGPVLLDGELGLRWRLGNRTTWGPYARGRVGTFTGARLETPAFLADGVHGRALHGWLGLGASFDYAF
jgi:hypothetical protein